MAWHTSLGFNFESLGCLTSDCEGHVWASKDTKTGSGSGLQNRVWVGKMLRVVHSSRGRDAVVPMMVAIVSENETGTAWLPLYTKPRIGCLCNSGFHPGAILSNRNDGVSREAAYKGNQVCSSSSFHFKAKAEALRSFFPPPMAPKSDNTEGNHTLRRSL